MGLTSKKVLLLAVVLGVLLFAADGVAVATAVAAGVAPVLGRVGMLLATQVSMVCALGLFANYSFGFYGSWADLFGQETAPGTVVDGNDASAAPTASSEGAPHDEGTAVWAAACRAAAARCRR